MKILILRLSSIGDIILTQPIVKRLHETYPQAEICYITKPQFQELPKHFGFHLTVIGYEKSLKFHMMQMRAHYDMVFDLHTKFSTVLIKLFCLWANHFTYDKKHQLRNAIVSHKTNASIKSTLDLYKSALEKAAKQFNQAALTSELSLPSLEINSKATDKIRQEILPKTGFKIVALFPGATHYTKMYPAQSYIEVIQKADKEYLFWLLGSKQEMELIKAIHSETGARAVNLCGRFNMDELLSVIALSDIVITNDSGPMHMAAALGKEQIAIFGSTHPKLGFAPLNDKAKIISKELGCKPCSLHGRDCCPQKHFSCMLSIKPEEIISIINDNT
jgi:heptosyltransferase II